MKETKIYQDLARHLDRLPVGYPPTESGVEIRLLKHPTLSIRVQVEDLRWSRHIQKTQSGYYLVHNQKNFFHSQVQQQLAYLLRPYGIGVWWIRAA